MPIGGYFSKRTAANRASSRPKTRRDFGAFGQSANENMRNDERYREYLKQQNSSSSRTTSKARASLNAQARSNASSRTLSSGRPRTQFEQTLAKLSAADTKKTGTSKSRSTGTKAGSTLSVAQRNTAMESWQKGPLSEAQKKKMKKESKKANKRTARKRSQNRRKNRMRKLGDTSSAIPSGMTAQKSPSGARSRHDMILDLMKKGMSKQDANARVITLARAGRKINARDAKIARNKKFNILNEINSVKTL